MADLPLGVDVVASLVRNPMQHVDAAIDDAEVIQAINFGVGKMIRAILSVRPQAFVTYVDPFTLSPGVSEYDISVLDPPCFRPLRLLVNGNLTNSQAVYFAYQGLQGTEFQGQETSRPGMFSTFLYDILDGLLPGDTITVSPGNSTSQFQVSPGVTIAQGTLVRIPFKGKDVTIPGASGATYPGTHYAIVTDQTGQVVTIAPPMVVAPEPLLLFSITTIRRRILKLAGTPAQSVSGRLYYDYRPARVTLDDTLDPLTSRFVDGIVAYAVSQLKLARGESDSRDYFQQAQELRSECMQEVEPGSAQNTENLGSGLIGLGDT